MGQMDQIERLRRAIEENTRELDEIRQKRFRTEEEILRMRKELSEKNDLAALFQSSGVLDELQQFGSLLQEEKQLTERLKDVAADGKEMSDLCERKAHARIKKQSLMAEIADLKRRLEGAKDPDVATQDMNHVPITRSKKNKSKSK